MSLLQLGQKYGTDKVTHGFLPFYESFMRDKKDKPVSFLEIGVFYGASIKMWAEYFSNPESIIYGADWFKGLNGNKHTFPNPRAVLNEMLDPRIKFVELNQASLDDLNKIKSHKLQLDYILDDGSHLMKDQQQTFIALFELIKPGGYYIIEDLHTSFEDGYDVQKDIKTTYAMVEDLKNKIVPHLAYGNLPLEIIDQIHEVQILHNKGSITSFIQKKNFYIIL
jgi:hypothetical protein